VKTPFLWPGTFDFPAIKLPKGKDPLLLAENKKDEDYTQKFDKSLENFFKII
jgi:hypothetical protein